MEHGTTASNSSTRTSSGMRAHGVTAARSRSLTTSMLAKFGVAVAVLIVVLAAVALNGQSTLSNEMDRSRALADTRGSLRRGYQELETMIASLNGKTLGDVLSEAEIATFRDEFTTSEQELQDALATAEEVVPRPGPLADAVDALAPSLAPMLVAANEIEATIDEIRSSSTEVQAAAIEEYREFQVVLDGFQEELRSAVDLANRRIEEVNVEADDAAARTRTLTAAAAAVVLIAFGLIGRRVFSSVRDTLRLQVEMARVNQMVENSPTNMMFCDTDLVIRFVNPASLVTLRKLEHLLPCRADEIVGQSIDIFHRQPQHQRAILGNPGVKLPLRSDIRLGDEVLDLFITAITDPQGRHMGAMATWEVITDKVRIEAEAAELQERERAATARLQAQVDELNRSLAAAAEGDLTATVTVSGDDAVGQMGRAVDKLLGDLRGSIRSIASNSEALAAAAEELQVVSSQMGTNSAETSRQVSFVSDASVEVSRNVETVSAASEQMSSSIKEIARNASEAAKVAGQAVEAARVTNDTVSKLGDSSAEIGQIVKVITGIAQQTNLLALNATIEAARAGEAGKGFAVVANEVKELAKETAKATEDISAKIEAIQSDTQSSVDSITGILSIIDQIARFQDTIASAVEEQAATTSEIARSVSDASRGSQEITNNMHTVANAAQSTASGADDSNRAASELARMATDLQDLVGRFRY